MRKTLLALSAIAALLLLLAFPACKRADTSQKVQAALSTLPLNDITSLSLNSDSTALLLGTKKNRFYSYSLSGNSLRCYQMPSNANQIYWIRQIQTAPTCVFLIARRDGGILYAEYDRQDASEVSKPRKCVFFSADSSRPPVKRIHFSAYKALEVKGKTDTTLYLSGSNGVLYLDQTDLEAARKAPNGQTLTLRYTHFLRKMRDGKMQFRIGDIYEKGDSLLFTTEAGIYRAPLAEINRPGTQAVPLSIEGLPQGVVEFSSLQNDTLYVGMRSKGDAKSRTGSAKGRTGSAKGRTGSAHIWVYAIAHPFGHAPKMANVAEDPMLCCMYPGLRIYHNGEVAVDGMSGRIKIPITAFGAYAHLVRPDALYFISNGVPKKLDLDKLRHLTLPTPYEVAVRGEANDLYLIDDAHNLYHATSQGEARLLGKVKGIGEKLQTGVKIGNELVVSGKRGIYRVNAAHYGLATQRFARSVACRIKGADEILTFAALADTALLVGNRMGLLRLHTGKGLQTPVPVPSTDPGWAPYLSVITPFRADTLLIGTLNQGLFSYQNGSTRVLLPDVDGIRQIACMGQKAALLTNSKILLYDWAAHAPTDSLEGYFECMATVADTLLAIRDNRLYRHWNGHTDSLATVPANSFIQASGSDWYLLSGGLVRHSKGPVRPVELPYWSDVALYTGYAFALLVLLYIALAIKERKHLDKKLADIGKDKRFRAEAEELRKELRTWRALSPARLKKTAQKVEQMAERKEEEEVRSKNESERMHLMIVAEKEAQIATLVQKKHDIDRQIGELNNQLAEEKGFRLHFPLYKRQMLGAQCVVRSLRAIGKSLRVKWPAEVDAAVDELGGLVENMTEALISQERFQEICEAEQKLAAAFGKHLCSFSQPIQGLINGFKKAQSDGDSDEKLHGLRKGFAKHLDRLVPYLDFALRESADKETFGFSEDIKTRKNKLKGSALQTINRRIFALVTFYRPANRGEITKGNFSDILNDLTKNWMDDFEDITRRGKLNPSIPFLECGMSDSYAKAFSRFLTTDEVPPSLEQMPLCSYYDLLWAAYLYPNRERIKYLQPPQSKKNQ